jgi:hypothetical protein
LTATILSTESELFDFLSATGIGAGDEIEASFRRLDLCFLPSSGRNLVIINGVDRVLEYTETLTNRLQAVRDLILLADLADERASR